MEINARTLGDNTGITIYHNKRPVVYIKPGWGEISEEGILDFTAFYESETRFLECGEVVNIVNERSRLVCDVMKELLKTAEQISIDDEQESMPPRRNLYNVEFLGIWAIYQLPDEEFDISVRYRIKGRTVVPRSIRIIDNAQAYEDFLQHERRTEYLNWGSVQRMMAMSHTTPVIYMGTPSAEEDGRCVYGYLEEPSTITAEFPAIIRDMLTGICYTVDMNSLALLVYVYQTEIESSDSN